MERVVLVRLENGKDFTYGGTKFKVYRVDKSYPDLVLCRFKDMGCYVYLSKWVIVDVCTSTV